MSKRSIENEERVIPSAKRLRTSQTGRLDRLSSLSDELLLNILSCLPIRSLIVCQRLSHRFHALASDSELWKRQYYARWVRPRAYRLASAKRTSIPPSKIEYTPKVSAWLDHSHFLGEGKPTNWKRQYRLRHNWSEGICRVTEIEFPQPPHPPALVKLCGGFIFVIDSSNGLRAWNASNPRSCVANACFSRPPLDAPPNTPTAVAVTHFPDRNGIEIAVGFENDSLSVYDLNINTSRLTLRFTDTGSTHEAISTMALSSPYLLTVSQNKVLSLYKIPSGLKGHGFDATNKAHLLASLRADNIMAPISLSIRLVRTEIIACIVYNFFHIGCGWSLGIQEIRLDRDGQQLGSRLATTVDSQYGIRPLQKCYRSGRAYIPPSGHEAEVDGSLTVSTEPAISHQKPPTSLSYSHPYLLASHADNTLTMYLLVSTSDSLFVKGGQRLWGHTSSVAAVQVSDRGKAVSVSSRGDEIRIWELETVLSSHAAQKKLKEENSVRLSPESAETNQLYECRGLDESRARSDDVSHQQTRMQGCVGFDDERVLLLREKERGAPLIEFYDFI